MQVQTAALLLAIQVCGAITYTLTGAVRLILLLQLQVGLDQNKASSSECTTKPIPHRRQIFRPTSALTQGLVHTQPVTYGAPPTR